MLFHWIPAVIKRGRTPSQENQGGNVKTIRVSEPNKHANFNSTNATLLRRVATLINCVLIERVRALRVGDTFYAPLPGRASLFIQDDCDPRVVNHAAIFRFCLFAFRGRFN